MRSILKRELIFDIGMSEGDDTDFYLKKGFSVVGVEADAGAYMKLKSRFATEVETGALIVVNKAGYSESGKSLTFFSNKHAQGHSRVMESGSGPDTPGELYEVESIAWRELVSLFGVPYYCKVDIEESEGPFLKGMLGCELPEFISVEAHSMTPITALSQAGYRQFRLIHQNNHNGFVAPRPALEGKYVPNYSFKHSSGYFGLELYGNRWFSYDEISRAYAMIQELRAFAALPHLWFDCHARFG